MNFLIFALLTFLGVPAHANNASFDGIEGRSTSSRKANRRGVRDIVRHSIPKVGRQNDSWSCGLNSGARYLQFHGVNVSYNRMREIRRNDLYERGQNVRLSGSILDLLGINGGVALQEFRRFGTPPGALRNQVNAQFSARGSSKRVRVYNNSTLNSLKAQLRKGPVIILIEPRAGYLHWVVVSGYTSANRFYINETNDKVYRYSSRKLTKRWLNWDGMLDWLPGAGLAEGVMITLVD